ncbi:MAG: hypothetical protein ABIE70_02350 [bacterium]
MSKMRVSLSPGIIRDPDTVMIVRIRSPREATDVRLTINEMDTWSYRGKSMVEWSDAANDPLATFTGSIKKRKFKVDKVEQAKAPAKAPILKVKFHGDKKVHELRIPDATLAEEGGELEIGVEVTGLTTRRKKVIPIEFRTSWPVFRRNYGPKGAQERPVITFITGRDKYHRAARQYWNRRADGISGLPSVEKILKFLRSQKKLKRYGDGHWGDVNIVSHANAWQWMIRLFHKHPRLKYVDSRILTEHGDDARLEAPGDDMLDAKSKIVLRGCVLGRNQALLDQIRTLFGGKAYIYSPKYLQAYQYYGSGRLQVAREYFEEFFFFYRPGRRSPNKAACLRLLSEKYPNAGIDNDEWGNLLRGKGDRTRKDKTERFRYTLDYENQVPPKAKADLIAALKDGWPKGDSTFNSDVDDWDWKTRRQVSGPKRNRRYRVICTGQRQRVEVRRPLKDAAGNVVVPNINEQTHYGRSPAWS